MHALRVGQWSQPVHSVQLLMLKALIELLKDLVHLVARCPRHKHQKLASTHQNSKRSHEPFQARSVWGGGDPQWGEWQSKA